MSDDVKKLEGVKISLENQCKVDLLEFIANCKAEAESKEIADEIERSAEEYARILKKYPPKKN